VILLDDSDPIGFNTPLGIATSLATMIAAIVVGLFFLYRNRRK
jgi:hypothetical protein